jgi:hypothetical protein
MSKVIWTPHPVLKIPTREQCLALGPEKTLELWRQREELVRKEKLDPYRYGVEPSIWTLADEQLIELRKLFPLGVIELMLFGGNRAGKSEYFAKRLVQRMIGKDNARWWAFQATETISQQTQQALIYKYLPLEWKPETGKLRKGVVANITYSQKGGFTESTFVMPNGSQCWFKFYAQGVETLEGAELDGVWLDELYTPEYLQAVRFRCLTRNGEIYKSFTPVLGYTPAVKEEMAGAKSLVEVEAELLPIYGEELTAENAENTESTKEAA